MCDSCPFSTSFPNPISIPSVPAQVSAEVTVVPRPSGDITTGGHRGYRVGRHGNLDMGGTTLPQYSSKNSPPGTWDSNQIYQARPPHGQNTLTPCEVIGEAPMMPATEPAEPENPILADPNRGPRRCYQIYSPSQRMVGRVCTNPGVDEIIDGRETYDGIGINGNADWVRGNRFGVYYTGSDITDRVKYNFKGAYQKQTNPRFSAVNPFYPYPGWCSEDDPNCNPRRPPPVPDSSVAVGGPGCWWKSYPKTWSYTRTGKPDWFYPYSTTQANSLSPVDLYPKKDSIHELIEVSEGFETGEKAMDTQFRRVTFWLVILIILLSLIYFSR